MKSIVSILASLWGWLSPRLPSLARVQRSPIKRTARKPGRYGMTPGRSA